MMLSFQMKRLWKWETDLPRQPCKFQKISWKVLKISCKFHWRSSFFKISRKVESDKNPPLQSWPQRERWFFSKGRAFYCLLLKRRSLAKNYYDAAYDVYRKMLFYWNICFSPNCLLYNLSPTTLLSRIFRPSLSTQPWLI